MNESRRLGGLRPDWRDCKVRWRLSRCASASVRPVQVRLLTGGEGQDGCINEAEVLSGAGCEDWGVPTNGLRL